MLYCNHSHGYWLTLIQINLWTSKNISMSDNLVMKPPWLFLSNKKKWGVRFWAPYCKSQLSTSKWHAWSEELINSDAKGPLKWQYIPVTDDPAVEPAWLFQNRRGSGQYDSGPQITYFTIVLQNWQTFSWVMIYNNPNNTANLHKHIHYWRLNCGAAVTLLRYGEDRERVLILAPDSRFPLSSYILQPFSWLLINDDPYEPIKLHKHTYEWKPRCKAAVTIYKKKEKLGVRF